MRKTFVLLITFLCFHNVYSQTDFREAYIITNEGDTISGFADYRGGANNFKSCNFKASENQESVVYSPTQLKAYRFVDDKFFESKDIKTGGDSIERHFLEVLVRGKVTLYKYRSSFYVEKNDTLFYKLTNEKKELIVERKRITEYDTQEIHISKYSNKHIGILNMLLFDCIGLIPNTLLLKERDLTRLIEKYNECTGEPSISFKEKKKWLQSSFGIGAGVNNSTINFKSDVKGSEYLTSNFDRNNSLFISVNIELHSPRISERIAFTTGLFYMSLKYTSFSEISGTTFSSPSITRNDVSIEFKQIKIPFGFRYTFPERFISPYFNLGGSETIHLSSSSLWIGEIERLNVVETYENEALYIRNQQFGIWAGVGAKKKITSKLIAQIEVRYERTNGIEGQNINPFLDSSIENIQLLLSLNF